MKKAAAMLVVVFLAPGAAGAVIAAEMSGVVKAADAAKGTITLSSNTVVVPFDGEQPMMSSMKVGDKVNVENTEKGGTKVATRITAEKAQPKPRVRCRSPLRCGKAGACARLLLARPRL